MVLTLVGASYKRVLGLLSVAASLSPTEEINHLASTLLPTFKLSLAEDDKDSILGPVRSHNHISGEQKMLMVWTGAVAMGMGGVMGFERHFKGRPAASGYGFHVSKEILAGCYRA